MRVFVGGATGYIGAAVAKALKAHGHEVLGSARNDAAAQKLKAAGITPVDADLVNANSFAKAARSADATIQTASTSDAKSPEYEPAAANAIVEALSGSKKPLVLTSGVWVYGSTGDRAATEDTDLNPPPLVAWRPAVEQLVLHAKGIVGSVVRPGVVYGGGAGIPAMFVGSAKGKKSVSVPGDGKNRWAPVHVDDLAELYVLALEKAPAGAIYNGTNDERITLGDIGRAIAKRHDAELVPFPIEAAREAMGPFADALALDQVIDAPAAHALGWKAKQRTLADELASGSYG